MNNEEIYIEYKDKVMAYLSSRLPYQYEVAEDLCADVFVKVYKNIENFDPKKASISTWIYHITQNTLIDYFRTNHSNEFVEIDENQAFTEDEDTLASEETLEHLADALEGLDQREKDIILMHYYKGQSLTDIAGKMGISYSYIKILHKNALNALKKTMGEFM